jgi:hypothetical protein
MKEEEAATIYMHTVIDVVECRLKHAKSLTSLVPKSRVPADPRPIHRRPFLSPIFPEVLDAQRSWHMFRQNALVIHEQG